MKLGTVVVSKEYGPGIFMYPHKRPVESDTMCSFLCKKNKLIYHLPFSAFEPYKNYCWSCDSSIDSYIDSTCNICHFVKCPVCGACKAHKCESASLQILDISDPSDWESITGFDIVTFFDGISESKYHYLGQEEYEEVERCCMALMDYNIQPLLIVDDFGMILVYVEKKEESESERIMLDIDGNLIPPIAFNNTIDMDCDSSGSCVICGEPTDDGDTLCPICADSFS